METHALGFRGPADPFIGDGHFAALRRYHIERFILMATRKSDANPDENLLVFKQTAGAVAER